SPRCQLTIVASQQPGFHFTLPITLMPDGSDELITPLSADNRYQPAARISFHATDNAKEGANKSLGTKTHHSKLLILNG
uniref:hypothetical protein n=1 Tax=Aeromonas caviae TaxID=648 RepID=UPI001C1F235C